MRDKEGIIVFNRLDIQLLNKKYCGDYLTPKEITTIKGICSPDSWDRVDDGGLEGCLSPLIQAIITIIKLVRGDRS